MYSRLGGGLHARLQTKAQRALSLCKKSDVGNTQPGPNPAPHSSPDTKQDGGRVLENQLSWRWQQQEEKEDYNGVKWLHHRGSLSGELRGCAGKVVCCAVSAPWAPQPLLRERNTTVHTTVAPQPLREEPTLYYARHCSGHTHACTATPLFHGNPAGECSTALSNVCKSSEIAGQPKFGGSSFRRRPIKRDADLSSLVGSYSSSSSNSGGIFWVVLVCCSMHAVPFGPDAEIMQHSLDQLLACPACHGCLCSPRTMS